MADFSDYPGSMLAFDESLRKNLSELIQDYYDDDVSDFLTAEEMKMYIPAVVSYSLIFLLGIAGNCLVIYCVAKYKRMKTITNQLLLSLACADLLLTFVCVPIQLAKLFSYVWLFGAAVCSLVHYVQTWSMVTSTMTLTAISLERYYAISRPLKAKYICTAKHARSVILIIWFLASVLSVPIIFVQKHYPVGLNNQAYWCNKHQDNLTIAYEIYILSLLFLLPVLTMAIAYGGVCIELWAVTEEVTSPRIPEGKNRKLKRGSSSGTECRALSAETSDNNLLNRAHNRDTQVRKQVLKMLFMVVIIFIICWCPYLSYNLAVALKVVDPYHPTLYPYVRTLKMALPLLAYSNSCLNPIVYGFMSRYFRKSFKQALSSCCLLKSRRQAAYLRKTCANNDRSCGSLRKPGEFTYGTDAAKRSTISTMAADSTLSRSPPISPTNTCIRQ